MSDDLVESTVKIAKEPIFVAEFGIPVPEGEPYVDLKDRVQAACKTMAAMQRVTGEDLNNPMLTYEDVETAGRLTEAYVRNPEKTSKAVTPAKIDTLPNGTLIFLNNVLQTYTHTIVEDAQQLRTYVTNRLIEESDNTDPRIRIKALELLGKIEDVGLFSEKAEVTVTHQASSEIKNRLRGRLEKLVRPTAPPAIEQEQDTDE